MKRSSFAPRGFAVFLIIGSLAVCSTHAQSPSSSPEVLDPLITTATRTPAAARTLGTATDVITANDLARRQTSSLAEALGGIAGAPHFSSGATGAVASIFLRGSNSNQTLFLVDGVRFNDPNTDYNLFLGGGCVGACDSLEIAHGPQSTLFGGEAVGGVISLRAQRGTGAPTASVGLEAGSFGTVQGSLAAQGARDTWAYSLSVQGGHTDNERPNNSFDRANVSLRLDRTVNGQIAVGGTVRYFHGGYGDPGDRYTNDPDNHEREDNLLVTTFAEITPMAAFKSLVTVGGQDRRFVSINPNPTGSTQMTVVKNRRAVLDWQNTYTGIERHRITGGLTADANHTRNTGFGDINEHQSLLAFFAQDEFSPIDDVYLTAGVRNDDYDTFGRATTGRATAAWLVAQRTLKLRASYGTGFRSPSFLDLYGKSAFYVGNPALHAERTKGWDVGVDYYLPEKRGTLSATWFESRTRDLIDYDFSAFPGTVVNRNRVESRGLELAAKISLATRTETQIAYSYLEAKNLGDQTRRLRRPRHMLSADVWQGFGERFSAGVGVAFVADRRDVDAATFATIQAEDYTVVRVYGDYKITEALHVKARVENLLNEKYEEVNGYPALGLGAYASVEYRF